MGNSSPNPMFSVIIFLILTIAYFVIKYIITSNKMNITYLSVLLYIYLGTLLLSQLTINIGITKQVCGTSQWQTAVMVTALPWILIFGALKILLSIFPGWLKPFSNTFGYGIAKIAGLNSVLDDILKPENATGDKKLSKALADIYSDRALLISHVGLENYDAFWQSLKNGKLLQKDSNESRDKLKSFIYLKTIVSEFIWFLLVGLLTVSSSYNYIINSACQNSVSEMKARRAQHQETIELQKEAELKAPERRVYSSFE